jgi:hypothetical protein
MLAGQARQRNGSVAASRDRTLGVAPASATYHHGAARPSGIRRRFRHKGQALVKKLQVLVKYDYGPGIVVRLRWLEQTWLRLQGESRPHQAQDG